MKNILDRIVAHKRQEVEKRKSRVSVGKLQESAYFSRSCHSLIKSLKSQEKSGVIAEFKRKSPSKDVINRTAKVEEVTAAYTQYGASGLSVLTDEYFFGGSDLDLQTARKTNKIPILRKDFIIDEYQILEAKAIGADVILLIAECLSAKEVDHFNQFAENLGLEVLLEMHSEQQLDKISSHSRMVGINNRDLTTFQVDIDRSIQLANQLPESLVKIAESGINDPQTLIKMRESGFTGFLMGEHFMKQEHPGEAFRKFVTAIHKD